MTTTDAIAPPRGTDAPPRWAVWAAHAVPLCVLPSSLWRFAMGLGFPVGYTDEALRTDFHIPGWGIAYVLGLSLLSEAAALLTLGLVRPWGERLPDWIPRFGGIPLKRRTVVVVAGTGAAAMFLLWDVVTLVQLLMGVEDDSPGHPTGGWQTLLNLTYLPLMLWGPLLAAVTYSYHRRRRDEP